MASHHLVAVVLALCLAQFPGPTNQFQHFRRHFGESEMRDGEEVSSHVTNATCREVYNYKHPHPCTPGVDCAFVVRWGRMREPEEGEGGGEWVEFQVTASLSGLRAKGERESLSSYSSVWVALGFSSNSKMGDADVTACWYHAGGYNITTGYNLPNAHTFIREGMDSTSDSTSNEGSGSTHSEGSAEVVEKVRMDMKGTKIVDGLFHCRFSRRMETSGGMYDRALYSKQYILAAVGPLEEVKGGQTKMLQHTATTASRCACDITSCSEACSCPVGFFYQMLKLHGVVMSLCFMLMLPTGAIISRYYKAVLLNTWFRAHVTLMVIGALWSVVGLGLVLTHTRGVFSVGTHQILGLLCLIMVTLQVTAGFLRPHNHPTKWRKMFNIFHKSMAMAILSLTSTVVLFWGVYLFHNGVLTYMYITLGLFVLVNLGFLLVLELLKRNQKFSSSPPVGYHKVRRVDESESDGEEEEVYVKEEQKPSEKRKMLFKFEKSILLVFVILNLFFSLLISTFILFFDSKAD